MFQTYILQSHKSSRYYIGSTKNIDQRVTQHNQGKVKATRNKGPWQLVHVEEFDTRSEAVHRELKIKSYKGGEAFKKLLGNK